MVAVASFLPGRAKDLSALPRTCDLFVCVCVSATSLVGIATRLWTGWSRVRIPAGARYFYLFQNVQTSSGSHTASHSMKPYTFEITKYELFMLNLALRQVAGGVFGQLVCQR